jgi:hypothetical protein
LKFAVPSGDEKELHIEISTPAHRWALAYVLCGM